MLGVWAWSWEFRGVVLGGLGCFMVGVFNFGLVKPGSAQYREFRGRDDTIAFLTWGVWGLGVCGCFRAFPKFGVPYWGPFL